MSEMKKMFSLQVAKDGLSASCDLRFLMAKSILQSIQQGFYRIENSAVVNEFGLKVAVQFLYDAATQHKGVSSVFSVVLNCTYLISSYENKQFGNSISWRQCFLIFAQPAAPVHEA